MQMSHCQSLHGFSPVSEHMYVDMYKKQKSYPYICTYICGSFIDKQVSFCHGDPPSQELNNKGKEIPSGWVAVT